MSTHSVIYTSFDRYPAPKGAATHIQAFVSALATEFGNVELVTVAGPPVSRPAGPSAPPPNAECADPILPGVTHTELPALGASLVERVLSFRTHLRAWWTGRRPTVSHVRSIFEGYPIARRKSLWCRHLVFEVNGLPSIELKYHYPQVADDRELMRKLLAQEQCCLEAADLIVTVSQVNAEYLRGRGVEPDRIRVIPNGVDLERFGYQPPRPWDHREIRLLYSGTLSSWQGVQIAIEALALYRREAPARLTVVGYGRAGQAQKLAEWAHQLGVAELVEFVDGVSQTELARLHHEADAILVPLMPSDRNIVQGCCPLKVLEAMASGTPLVASDLPVVAALARPEVDAILVRPNSAKAIKDALLRLRGDPETAVIRSRSARQRIESQFTWKLAQQRLVEAYRQL
jgi:glycosyltransferase involved in cell wall biosynthesis